MRLPESSFIALNRRWQDRITDAAMGPEGNSLPWLHPSDLIAQCIDTIEEEIAQREAHLVARAAVRANLRGAPYVAPTVEVLQQRERTFRATEEMIKALRTVLGRYTSTGFLREWLRQPASVIQSYRQQIVSARRTVQQQGAAYELDEWRQDNDPRSERKEEQIRSGIANRRATLVLLRKMLEQYDQSPNLTIEQLILPAPEHPEEQESAQLLGRTGGARTARAYTLSSVTANPVISGNITYSDVQFSGTDVTVATRDETAVWRPAAQAGGNSGEVLAAEQSAGPGVSAGPGGSGGERHRWNPVDEGVQAGPGPEETAVDTPDAPLRASPTLSLRNILDATGDGYRAILGRARGARSNDE
jgi:hypothetical protein